MTSSNEQTVQSSNEQSVQPQPSRRLAIIILGAISIALVTFGIGYSFGRSQPAAESAVEPAPPAQAEMNNSTAGNLSELLPGLQAKVAADPKNVDQRVLLAQTYGELGQRDKAIKELRTAHGAAPQDARITILLATALMENGSQTEMRESYKLLDEAVRRKPAVAPMARLYQGDILTKLGDNRGAVKVWKSYLAQMSAGDQRRDMFESRIAQASSSP